MEQEIELLFIEIPEERISQESIIELEEPNFYYYIEVLKERKYDQ